MARKMSRADRLLAAAADAREKMDALREAVAEAGAELVTAMADLADVREEYQEWYDNMPEGLQDGATGEKLLTLLEIDLPDDEPELDLDEWETALDEVENAELPLGFGRD